jgi:hypothetical protein
MDRTDMLQRQPGLAALAEPQPESGQLTSE